MRKIGTNDERFCRIHNRRINYDTIRSGGAEAGKLELLSTSLNVARSYAKKMFEKGGQDFEKQMPNFDKNYTLAQRSAKLGFAKEKICCY